MRHQWQALLELIWSSRYDPVASHERRMAVLQAVLAIAIAVAAGPEIVAAIEMTALMELLGTALFLTAMGAGAKLAALNIWNAIRSIAFPAPLSVAVRPGNSIPANALALTYVAGHATWCVAMALNCRCMGTSGYSVGQTSE